MKENKPNKKITLQTQFTNLKNYKKSRNITDNQPFSYKTNEFCADFIFVKSKFNSPDNMSVIESLNQREELAMKKNFLN